MRILFIVPEYYPHSGGGIATYYQHYIAALKPHVSEIKVIVGSGYLQSDESFEHDGIAVEYLKPALYQKYLSLFSYYELTPEFQGNLAASWGMWEQANKGTDYDIIECTDFGLGFVAWTIEHTKPVLTRLHGSTGQISLHENLTGNLGAILHTTTEINLLPLCDSLVTHSKANQHFWRNVFPLKKVEQFYPIYSSNHVPLPFNKRGSFGLITARIQKWKGPIEVCDAISSMEQSLQLKWIGRDMDYNSGQRTSEYLRTRFPNVWGERIVSQQPLPVAEINILQQQSKFGLIPSTWDMFNFTCLEFLSFGTPVVCSDGAGVSELIDDGENGFKFIANDKQSLIKALELVNNLDEPSFNAMTAAGLKTIETSLSPKVLIPQYILLYQDLYADFKKNIPNILIEKLYRPNQTLNVLEENLSKLPLKRLFNYVIKRMLKKISLK